MIWVSAIALWEEDVGNGAGESNTATMPINIRQLYAQLQSGKIVLPRFQRANVWKKKQKQALIESIRKGLPIGSLLVYQSLDPSEGDAYVLVDGLQRTIAIRDYLKSSLKYISAHSLESEELEGVVDAVREVAAHHNNTLPRARIYTVIEEWIRSAESLDIAGGLDSDTLADRFADELVADATDGELRQIRKAANKLIGFVQKDADISGYPLAVVRYSGSSDKLPEIFRNINSGGTPLDDFDEFATDWIEFKAEITNKAVKDVIHHKWKVAENKGLTIEQWGPNGPTAGYTLWEYIYGLGRVLKEKHPFLFGRPQATQTAHPLNAFPSIFWRWCTASCRGLGTFGSCHSCCRGTTARRPSIWMTSSRLFSPPASRWSSG